MLVILAAVMMILAMLAIGVVTTMRVVVARQDLQRMADAACLAAAQVIKENGLGSGDPTWQEPARAIAYRNDPGPVVRLLFSKTEAPQRIDVTCQTSLDVRAPFMIWESGRIVVSATAQATVKQVTQTEATRLFPNLVLVLDYSGSMMSHLGGSPSQPTSIAKLRDSVQTLLSIPSSFKYGLVIFGTQTLDSSPLAQGNESILLQKVGNSPSGCPENEDNDCLTNTYAALQSARKMIEGGNPDEAKHVLLVSDGYPTYPTGDRQTDEDKAFSEAQKLWADDVGIITLHIINVGSDQQAEQTHLMNFMKRLSGFPEKPSDPSYYFNADSAAGMDDLFGALADAIGCPLPALDPSPKDPKKIHVFVKVGSTEIPVGNAALQAVKPATTPGDLTSKKFPYYDGNWFFYRPTNHTIYLSRPVCSMVIDDGDPVVVRAGSVQLTQ